MKKAIRILIRLEISEIRHCRTQARTLERMADESGDDNLSDVARGYWVSCAMHRGKLIAYRNVQNILRDWQAESALARAKLLMPNWP